MRLAGRKGNGERRGAAGGERDREKGVRTYRTSVSVGVSYSPTDAAHWSPKKKRKGAVSPAAAVIARYKPARRNPQEYIASNSAMEAFGTPFFGMKAGRRENESMG